MVKTSNNTSKFFFHFSKGHKFLTLICNVILHNACIKKCLQIPENHISLNCNLHIPSMILFYKKKYKGKVSNLYMSLCNFTKVTVFLPG